MSGFHAPFSSSPPSTPDRQSSNGKHGFFYAASNPSTTPAGPPPSSGNSFTPVGPPPSSVFGSSMLNTSTNPMKSLSFSQATNFDPSHLNLRSSRAEPYGPPSSPPGRHERSPLGHGYQDSPLKSIEGDSPDYDEDEDEDVEEYTYEEHIRRSRYEDGEDEEEYEEEYEDEDEDRDAEADEDEDATTDKEQRYSGDEEMEEDVESELSHHELDSDTVQSNFLISTSGLDGPIQDRTAASSIAKSSEFGQIAKDICGQLGIAIMTESDELILNTEATMNKIYGGFGITESEDEIQRVLGIVPGELAEIWNSYDKKTAFHDSEEYAAAIGPGPKATDFSRANYLAGLALKMHHQNLDQANNHPLPLILLEWMDEFHDPYPSQIEQILAHRPSPSNHHLFWDSLLSALLRGKLGAVMGMLKNGGWKYANSGPDDFRATSSAYSELALANIEKVVDSAAQLLSQCPALKEDWDIRGSDWTLYRLRVSQALEDLKRFAEGRDKDDMTVSTISRSGRYSEIAKKAESRVPWHIYQNLLTFYGLMMGDSTAIISNAQDWCEATVGLLVWWDEGSRDRQVALGRSRASYRASATDSDWEIYMRKLRRAFRMAISDSTDFQVNTLDPVELGLASLFEGNNEAVISFLRAWSGPISSSVAEIASLGKWLSHTQPGNLIGLESLDEEDMDLLGISSSPGNKDGIKDQTLVTYARSLSQRGQLNAWIGTKKVHVVKEGWELSIAVLGRLDSAARSDELIGDFLKGIPLDLASVVDKLWKLLNNDLGMTQYAESIAEAYADQLAESSHQYGDALWYYALAHKDKKVKDVLDLLISYSLIQSTAFPPDAELDGQLRHLISSPKIALTEMSQLDLDAAQLLHKMLSGYATLRRFYSVRDQALAGSSQSSSQSISLRSKREAAAALAAVITSSSDNIRGGLYDEERGAVVSVDFLLALLGEAMVFVNQPKPSLTVSQIDTLLKAIEDLQTVGPRVYSACSEFLETVIASAQGLKGSTPADLLRKSTSNLSGTSNFSLVGSSMLASQLKQSMSSSGLLGKSNIKRAWDWRKGITVTTTGEDLLQILRLSLAKDLAKAWLLELDDME